MNRASVTSAAAIDERQVEVGGFSTHYLSAGHGSPMILLLFRARRVLRVLAGYRRRQVPPGFASLITSRVGTSVVVGCCPTAGPIEPLLTAAAARPRSFLCAAQGELTGRIRG